METCEEGDLFFGDDATGEGDRAAFTAGVLLVAVEVHVLGPVGVRHTATAAKLRTHTQTFKMEEKKKTCCCKLLRLLLLCYIFNLKKAVKGSFFFISALLNSPLVILILLKTCSAVCKLGNLYLHYILTSL